MTELSKLADLQRRLEGLHRKTEAGFAERAQKLCDAAAALEDGDAAARETIQRLAHQLRGVAGTAGHASLTDRAGRLEDAARGSASALAIAEGARRLAQFARSAARGEDRPDREVRNPAGTAPPTARSLAWRVVVLDDEPSTRRLLSITLRQAGGCDAHVVGDPAAAMNLVRAHRTDLVIVDAMMPELDGLSFYRAVRRLAGPELPVVILSAATAAELGWELPDDPRLGWMRKPFRPGALLDDLLEFVGA